MSISHQNRPSRGDRWSIAAFSIVGFAIAAWITVTAVLRIIVLATGTNVPVRIEFVDGAADIALSDGSATVPVQIDSGVLLAPQLTPIAIVPGILGQLALIVTVVTIVGCLLLLSRSIIGGRVFSRRNTALVATTGLTGLIGAAAARFFDNMLANATVSLMTENRLDTAVLTVEPFTWILAAFIVAVIMTAFTVGDRLQRDKATLEKETEGLI
ncbi:hypothetical protein KZC52_13390 [Microbacterium sp. kSW2-24]|uniref:hypothetical protein n=1 Tax=Microbacterium galbinum TaxID=2851646 RepID=UPI001FFCC1D4|nr:hypothetical protein [Microbacterium galbinum]MCK2023927.1 hypothetical protein [Microbacterium galbinum]